MTEKAYREKIEKLLQNLLITFYVDPDVSTESLEAAISRGYLEVTSMKGGSFTAGIFGYRKNEGDTMQTVECVLEHSLLENMRRFELCQFDINPVFLGKCSHYRAELVLSDKLNVYVPTLQMPKAPFDKGVLLDYHSNKTSRLSWPFRAY